jgi:TldD protein
MNRTVKFSTLLALSLIGVDLLGQNTMPKDADSDPVLHAMLTEMQRSKAQLKLDGVAAPYYIDYRITDSDRYGYEAAYGASRGELRVRTRFLRVVVRIGDYKQDSFYSGGEGMVEIVGTDDDEIAIRRKLWLATDQAYKSAAEALAAKRAALKQFTIENPTDDFAHAEPVRLIGPLVKLDRGVSSWAPVLREVSAFYKKDPQIETIQSSISCEATNRYFVNSEGSIIRTGASTYALVTAASTQAADGMRLERSTEAVQGEFSNLPSPSEFKTHAQAVVGTLQQLRAAPVVEEEYRGPVLFEADAATVIFASLIGENVLGRKPALGQPARVQGAFASSYLSKVLPDFLSVTDDPTISSLQGETLLGHYDVDDEGVRPAQVTLVDIGKLSAYDLGRIPIRDFPASNGHGRAQYPMNPPGPSLGNLILQSSEPLSQDALKAKLIELCKQRDLPYCYIVRAAGPRNSPRLLLKVFTSDGHEQLVRGATFGDLDTRSMRNDVVAAGDKATVDNLPGAIPHSIVSPALLFDELEVKRVDQNKDKLPEYPPPQLKQ